MDRRTWLATTAALAGLSGCLDAANDGEAADATPGDGTPAPDDGTPAPDATPTPEPVHESYETTEVGVVSEDGSDLGSVTAAVADTQPLRVLGLSDTESLPEDRGMLFVYESVADRTFVMRRMDFGIDIVYADSAGTVTKIHHAPAPGPDEDGNDQRYPGRGQYVLEVNYEWTTRHGVEAGDRLEFDLG